MKISPSSAAALHDTFLQIAHLYSGEEDQLLSTDFYFMPDHASGSLTVFNDMDEEIAKATITEWTSYPSDIFYNEVASDLTDAISKANTEGELERLAVWMPYSFVLVDENRESVCDLLLVDNDTLLVTDPLLKGLDEELNKFIEDLLK